MDYKEFQRLFDGDRIVFMMGMELFLANGRIAVMENTEEKLGKAIEEKLAGFLVREKISAVVKTAKAFAQLETATLLSYIGRSGMQLNSNDMDISGVCPVCGGPLIYGENSAADSGDSVGWTCQDCDATGKEVYRQVFDCHSDVRLGDGRPVPPREH